jgi:hypothetical protein
MRSFLIFALAVSVSIVAAQGDQPVLLSGKPDVIVTVRKSDVGADYVRIQALRENYPAELMKRQVEELGRIKGSQIRGLEVTQEGGGRAGSILSATFATDGLMNQKAGTLELNAFAKAFAGAESPNTVHVIAVMYEGFQPNSAVTVAEWADDNTEVSSHYDVNMKMADYRIKLKTQNPDVISIPGTIAESTNRAQTPSNKGFNPWPIVGVIGGAALIGLLVYFVLRPRSHRGDAAGTEKR